ncbi:MAG: prephenate dehydratase [Gammaproteobacteria bacterium]|nr:prephenate dehydratase [Rhodocyclaceae bacterium]MBU3908513.1 prephenate dehydratase [Gammaproteobacteria bacterium]MBU3990494.1 prephenate dehydratase [Gammaproteobacteria bacterium]MBU4004541.1 prephenate dehydratase [Gammaproteobacteria bacterium]MBU4021144.1 prephenate dehydratase [Gammaproteobacteria bacterium]
MASSEEELGKLRDGIDHIDNEVLRLLSERARLAHRVGTIKHGNIYRPEREAQVLKRIAETNPGPLPEAAVRTIFREVMSACLALEQPLRIAYFGPAGTFTESAAKKHFGSAPTFTPFLTIDDVFRAVESGQADYGVVPVENSTEGSVGRTLDLMLTSPLMICGEVNLRIHQNLMARATELSGVKRLYSHAQSLAQCHEWLNRNLAHVARVPVASNAEAARMAAQDPEACAIAGEAAARLYELNILAANIEDDPNNTTRFIALAGHDAGPSGNGQDKTSFVCSAQNKPGAVHDLLTPLKRHEVSMSRFESRPARGFGNSRWEYVFFIDIEGHRQDAKLAAALDDLRGCVGFLKELGSYPRASN